MTSSIDNRQSTIDIFSIPILSVCQPYAYLIVHGPKRVENRTWATNYRGWIGIHASKGRRYMDDWEQHAALIGDPSVLQFGAVIGVARLVECVGRKDRTDKTDRTYDWVIDDPWFEGPVGWVLLEARPIEPFPCRGKTMLFRLPNNPTNPTNL